MAVTTEGIDKAEIAVCVEISTERLQDGSWAQTVTPLPWTLVKFADASETNRYVMPASNGLYLFGAQPYRQTRETMRRTAFPHDADYGPRPTTGEGREPGPRGVHFFASTAL